MSTEPSRDERTRNSPVYRWREVTRAARGMHDSGDSTELVKVTAAVRHVLGLGNTQPREGDVRTALHRANQLGYSGDDLARRYMTEYLHRGGTLEPAGPAEYGAAPSDADHAPHTHARLTDLTAGLSAAANTLNATRDTLGEQRLPGAHPEDVHAALTELHTIHRATITLVIRLRGALAAGAGGASRWASTDADPVTLWRLARLSLAQAEAIQHEVDALIGSARDSLSQLHSPAGQPPPP